MTLADLQELFWVTMRAPTPDAAGLPSRVNGNAQCSSLDRVGVYHFAYWERQERVLFDEFRRLAQRLGIGGFRRLARAYLREHPSHEPRIEWLGRELGAYLRRSPDPELAAHADLAAFEWAETEVLVEGDPVRTVTGFDVAVETVPTCQLRFLPALRMLALTSDLLADGVPGLPAASGARSFVAIWRPGFHLRHRVVDADEYAAFEAARGGALLADVCQSFAAADSPEVRAATVLRGWFQSRWITDVVSPTGENR
jgi:hypothetical protein